MTTFARELKRKPAYSDTACNKHNECIDDKQHDILALFTTMIVEMLTDRNDNKETDPF